MLATKLSHKQQILRKLQTADRVSNFDLFKITPRYSARIYELRNEGYDIQIGRDRGTLIRKPRPNMFWFVLKDRFEISVQD